MNMTATDFIALLPLLIVTGTSIVIMLAVAIRRRHAVTAVLTLAGLAVAFASVWVAATVAPRQVTPLLFMGRYALFYIGLILAASMAFVLLAYGYFRQCEGDHDELYIVMLVATLGSSVLAASSHLVSLFLGLELLSVSLYAMISYLYQRPLPLGSRPEVSGAGSRVGGLFTVRNRAALCRAGNQWIWRASPQPWQAQRRWSARWCFHDWRW